MNRVNKWKIKVHFFSFVTGLGRHTAASFGKDLGLHSFKKTIVNSMIENGGKLTSDHFSSAHQLLGRIELGMRTISVIGKITAGLMDHDSRSTTNTGESLIPFASQDYNYPIGKNDCVYYTTNVHLGIPTSSKITHIKSGPFIETLKKTLVDTTQDYQQHSKRKELTLKSGFNEKGFAFLMEDTYLSVKDYLTLYDVEKRFGDEMRDNKKDLKDIYGCGLKTFHQLKIRNRIECYSLHVQVHLIKILDLETDIRSLLQEITHHSENAEYQPPYNSGKILIEDQYSTPDFRNKSKRFALDFQTSLSCNLSNSFKFRERAKIVWSWRSTLAPGSTWEFNLTYHLGRGLHLNYFYDLENKDHPSGFILCLKYIG